MQKVRLFYCLFISISLSLTACSFQNEPNKQKQGPNLTAAQILGDSTFLAICYGGYRAHTRDTQPSISQIKEDMLLLNAIGIKLLRTYNTSFLEARNVLQAIRELRKADPTFEMYVMLGAWIDCKDAWTNTTPNHEEENEEANIAEIERAVEMANQFPEIVKVISVGNEAMVRWATSYYVKPAIILKWVTYLQQLKKERKLSKNVWITSSDNFASWGGGDTSYHTEDLKKLYEAVDFVSIHTYPMHDTHYNPIFWGLKTEDSYLPITLKADSLMVRSVRYAQMQYLSVRNYMQSIGVDKPIHIGETGWATADNHLYGAAGSSACDEYKSAKYYQLMRAWTNQANITCFYFEAFDEQWKDVQNAGGSENHFGLFTIDGKAKYALWEQVDKGAFNGLSRDGNSIIKTMNGNQEDLMKRVLLPKPITTKQP